MAARVFPEGVLGHNHVSDSAAICMPVHKNVRGFAECGSYFSESARMLVFRRSPFPPCRSFSRTTTIFHPRQSSSLGRTTYKAMSENETNATQDVVASPEGVWRNGGMLLAE